jgi:Na+/alanine symporter
LNSFFFVSTSTSLISLISIVFFNSSNISWFMIDTDFWRYARNRRLNAVWIYRILIRSNLAQLKNIFQKFNKIWRFVCSFLELFRWIFVLTVKLTKNVNLSQYSSLSSNENIIFLIHHESDDKIFFFVDLSSKR